MQLVDATGAEGAVPGDIGIFGMAYAASDLAGELLADHAALPHAAAPQAEAEQEHERQEQRELREAAADPGVDERSEDHTSELQSLRHLVCRLLLEKKK